MLILLACTTTTAPDPQFEPVRQSLEAYLEGTTSLEGGDPTAAEGHFDDAIAIDTSSATLRLWRAQARAEQGDLQGAIEGATEALQREPDFLEARYDRACWRSQNGDLEGAAEDLTVALQDPTLDPLFVARDPGLDALRASELGAVIPKPVLAAVAEVSEAAVFVGGEVVVTLTALHPGPLSLRHDGPDSSVLALRKVIEDRSTEGSQRRTELRLSWTVLGAGEVPLGPWTFSSDGLSGVATGGVVRALAPEGHAPSSSDTLADDWVLPSALPASVRSGDPGDPVPEGTTVVYELRDNGQPLRVAWK